MSGARRRPADDVAAPRDPRNLVLAIDTATTTVIVALGTRDGTLVAADAWVVGHRHAEELLGRVEALLAAHGLGRNDLPTFAGLVVGTGPGAFTGLRVGLATAKALARGLELPLVGIPTGQALLAADGGVGPAPGPGARPIVLLLPAGPADVYLVTEGDPPTLLHGADRRAIPEGAWLVALDLGTRAGADALARGEVARAGLPGALVRLGAARLAAGDVDDPALLVPEYVTLPRGARGGGEVSWSPARP